MSTIRQEVRLYNSELNYTITRTINKIDRRVKLLFMGR